MANGTSDERKPFHESVVDELNRLIALTKLGRASAYDFRSACNLVATTKIPKGHEGIRLVLAIAAGELGGPIEPWLSAALESVTEQESEAAKKEPQVTDADYVDADRQVEGV